MRIVADRKSRDGRMRGARGWRTMFAAILLGTCLVPRPSVAAAEDAGRQAEAFIRRGVELRQAGDDDAAARQFRKAYELARTPRAAAQLGLAEQALGRWEDAESHLSESLLTPNDPWIFKHVAVLRGALTNIKEHVGRVEVIGEPEGAEVFVNGKLVGKVPMGDPIHVRAGDVHVELRAPGYVRSSRSENVGGGQYQSIVIRLERERAVPGTAALAGASVAPAGTAPPPGGLAIAAGGNRDVGDVTTTAVAQAAATAPPGGAAGGAPFPFHSVAKWTAVGLSAGAMALAVTATFRRYDKTSQFENQTPRCSDVNGRAVYEDNPTVAAPQCQGLLNDYRTARTWQIVGFVGAGVFGITALVLALSQPEAAVPGAPRTAALSRRPALFDWACTTTVATPGLACQAHF